MPYVYKYIKEGDKFVLTEKTKEIDLYWIERILGKVPVKNSKVEYELIEIRNNHFDVNGLYLVKRKDIKDEHIKRFLQFYSNGTRSVQTRPYTDDLMDEELLSEHDIKILTYKHYYIGKDTINDIYYPVKSSDITDELIAKLETWTKDSMDSYNRKHILCNKQKVKFEPVKSRD